MRAQLSVPVLGNQGDRRAQSEHLEVVDFDLVVIKARLVSNDWNHADELHLTANWKDASLDPRTLTNAVCRFWLANANDDGRVDLESPKTLRFIGMLVRSHR